MTEWFERDSIAGWRRHRKRHKNGDGLAKERQGQESSGRPNKERNKEWDNKNEDISRQKERDRQVEPKTRESRSVSGGGAHWILLILSVSNYRDDSDSNVHRHADRREEGWDVSIISGESFNFIPPCFYCLVPHVAQLTLCFCFTIHTLQRRKHLKRTNQQHIWAKMQIQFIILIM